ncbi:poly(A) RNA polymerase, mitochondrial-like [Bradysia coprophila]|uniref:poly(A) RNA polymerase, mitochondrial-like n=1 Tax=Bradysia coprophila TaxID=38358 RepID=UPI00187D971E|nr:poly(A) RNA polymerase, mitochondrial-like [Bradysia coprophila]
MHRLISNSVKKFKHINFSNWITEINRKNVARGNGVHTLSGLNAKNLNEKANKMINFDEMVTSRREQAQRSILVQVQSQKSFTDLQKYCSQFGKIIGGHHYVLADRQFILIEFSSQVEAQQAISCSTFEDATGFCTQGPFLWFRAAAQNGSVAKDTRNVSAKLMVSDGCRPIDYNKINEVMLGAASLSDQIGILFRSTILDDLGIRMRFLAARQIEESISSIFPSARACIFGSSVNGYGKLGCDLDLILHFHSLDCDIDTTKRLVFHTKKLSAPDSRSDLQKNLVTVSGIVQRFLPGISNVRTILPARVPIIKYHHDFLDLEVDVSLNNMSGVYMSELLYMFTQIDHRVQPLVYTIRRWAQTSGVTRPSPGFWISNFSLTCLVIFYLQQLSKPVLPTIESLIQQARPQDKRLSDEEAPPCTFLRDLNVLKFTRENTDSLSDLLAGFFEYYSQMNFAEKAISLNDAQLLTKPNNAAVYMINPLDPSLNVTKNMSIDERERFCIEARNAAWFLASTDTTATKRDQNDSWGLLNLLRDPGKAAIRPTMFFKSRMVELESFFGKDSDDVVNENVDFKNSHVKKEIANIQKKKKSELTKMKAGRTKR